ncbi:MAG: bifunctional N-acetylglucosamine-1-phosphate uridyltransferase/glucosamine-1-phosphate acetyltransferase [Planctomycetes bacterium]|nr:bifunctional N-acetylglucosamine-1-phosphate uridyltransferase/glucosamine-1-phosphate acetyltransferase [Planctomycetota bacterium]
MKGSIPKVLHPILGRTVLGHVLDALVAAGVAPADTVLVVGRDGDAVRDSVGGRGYRFVVQDPPLGTGDAVRCALPAARPSIGVAGRAEPGALPDLAHADLVVLCGDAPLVSPETIALLLERRRSTGAACVLLSARLAVPGAYGRVLRSGDGSVSAIVEAADADEVARAVDEVNAGAYAFDRAALARQLPTLKDRNAQREVYLTDAVRGLASAGERVEAVEARDPSEVMGVNSREELAAATRAMRDRVNLRHMDSGVSIVDPASTWIDVDARIAPDVVIHPFTVISGDVEIGPGCEVGPFTHLRPGTVLEEGSEVGNFVEVKKTRLGSHTKAKHLAYLGDGQVGSRVNIGAGTIFANYDGRSKHRTVVEDGAFIGSGTVLVAPVSVGSGAVTGAGAVVLAGQDVPPGDVAVGVPARLLGRTAASPAARSEG